MRKSPSRFSIKTVYPNISQINHIFKGIRLIAGSWSQLAMKWFCDLFMGDLGVVELGLHLVAIHKPSPTTEGVGPVTRVLTFDPLEKPLKFVNLRLKPIKPQLYRWLLKLLKTNDYNFKGVRASLFPFPKEEKTWVKTYIETKPLQRRQTGRWARSFLAKAGGASLWLT